MGWCDHCQDDCPFGQDPCSGYTCCTGCGKVVEYDVYTNEPTFEKTSDGGTRLAGSVFNNESGISASRERTLDKGKDEIERIVSYLEIAGGTSIVGDAHRFYKIAVDRSFTKGRRTSQVAAACLYLACRASKVPKPYLLIDFSEYLQINVYVLGAVFLQLCKMLRVEDHPFVQNNPDPTLYIHRFTERLLGGQRSYKNPVSQTALRIVASMKRDWMQTGRKPSGLCGAALYISSLSHGLNYSKSEIVSVVHICEATLTKRLVEFENTESGSLTIEEFLKRADELRESDLHRLPIPGKVLCKHKDMDVPHFAHGLCKECHDKFIEISGGVEGGAEPPAFQRAERQRSEKEKEKEMSRELGSANIELLTDEIEVPSSCKIASDSTRNESVVTPEPESTGDFAGQQRDNTFSSNQSKGWEDPAVDDRESLSDIDDDEVGGYIHNEEEKLLKEIAWTEMNREYLEEQAAKEAAAAEGLPKVKKERKQRRAEDNNSIPADTPLKATRQMLDKKKLSSRINYEALDALYNSDQGNTKKQRTESDIGQSEEGLHGTTQEHDNAQDEGFEEADYGGYGDGDEYSLYQDGTVDF